MWVCVSDNFDVKTVVKKMLESLGVTLQMSSSLDDLQNKLRENLMGKKYLLVLDDIWRVSHEKWTQLSSLLTIGAQGSKILATTRNRRVADTMGGSGSIPFVLNGLTVEESWSLLKNQLITTSGAINQSSTLETIGKQIAEKCKGVPLAIRTMDGWKASKENIVYPAYGKLSSRLSKVDNWSFSLVQISLFNCQSLQCLPPLENLPHLKSLHIRLLTELEYIYYNSKPDQTFFPSLKSLSFSRCGKLKGWWRKEDEFNDHNHSSSSQSQSHDHEYLSFSPCLSQIEIDRCPKLINVPTFPNIHKIFELRFCGKETLEATLKIAGSQCSIHFPSYDSLSDHESVQIGIAPKVWMQNLTSLEHLKIEWFSLEDFQKFEIWFNDIDGHLNRLPSLQKITFAYCEVLRRLPDWTYKLSSLQHITFNYCKGLALLDERMTRFTKLQTLEIIDCPLLYKECHTERSTIWPILAHIPKIICDLR